MGKQIILLNGPSSSGKSTLAKKLQTQIAENKNEHYEIVSIDDFLKMTTDTPIYEDDVFEISFELCEKVVDALKSNPGAIIDHVITSERIFKQLMAAASSYDVILVHVTCPLEVLRNREENRRNRCLGSAEASYEFLYPKEGYDLTVDTFAMTIPACSLKIIELLK